MSPEEQRDWDEYLAWTRGAADAEYEQTERLAWERLQSASLRRRIAPVELESDPVVAFTPDEGIDIDFTPA